MSMGHYNAITIVWFFWQLAFEEMEAHPISRNSAQARNVLRFQAALALEHGHPTVNRRVFPTVVARYNVSE